MNIILHDQLVLFDHGILPFFLLRCLFIAGRICINDVTQQCHITWVCLSYINFFRSHVIRFFILDDLSCPRCYSSLEVDLLLSVAWSYHDPFESLSFVMISLFLGDLGSSLFFGVNLLAKMSSLVLRNKSHPSFLVGDCSQSFLQVK